jgi:hypothetical protein
VKRSPIPKSVAAVIREAERCGVTVQFGATHRDPTFVNDVNAPMHDGYVDDAKRIVYVCGTREEFEQLPHAAPALMHEVNHAVLGCAAEEDGAMLALDHEAYRRLRLAGWSHWMKGYDLGSWSKGSTKYRNGCLRYAYKKAAQERVIVDGKPNYDGAKRAREWAGG